jgi:hypothetical protein
VSNLNHAWISGGAVRSASASFPHAVFIGALKTFFKHVRLSLE